MNKIDFDVNTSYSIINGKKFNYNTEYDDMTCVYEVIRLIKSGPMFFVQHVDRLNTTLKLKKYNCTLSYDEVFEDLLKLIEVNGARLCNIKLSIFAVGDGYTRVMKYIPSSYPDDNLRRSGVLLKKFKFQREEPNSKVFTDEMKKLRLRLQEDEAFEFLLIDKENRVRECSKSNIFFYKDATFYTATDDTVLGGITRSEIIKIIEAKYKLVYKNILVDEISDMEGAFITGTSLGALSVNRIDDVVYPKEHMDIAREINEEYLNNL